VRTRFLSVTLPTPWTLPDAFALLAFLAPRVTSATNDVVALLDDVGVDKISAYYEGPTVPPTPNLNALARRGLLFRNAWATPSCSPTRAAVLTGRRGELTGLGSGIPPGPGMSPEEFTIADALREGEYATAAIGKWHLEHDPTHPL
jgi:arylsulfatase A-like enzyme